MIMMEDEVTAKIAPIPRPNFRARCIDQLERARGEAEEVGDDIVDAIDKLIARLDHLEAAA